MREASEAFYRAPWPPLLVLGVVLALFSLEACTSSWSLRGLVKYTRTQDKPPTQDSPPMIGMPVAGTPSGSGTVPQAGLQPAVQADITRMRPYSPESPWNTPIGQDPKYDLHSDQMIATLGLDNGGQFSTGTENYSYTVYYADSSTPRLDLPCIRYLCTVVTPDGSIRTDILEGVPIPFDAQPAGGTDNQMIVIDKNTLDEYNLWGVKHTKDGWHIRNGSRYNLKWDALPSEYGSRGAGVPYLAGLIRPWEIASGHIDHVIGFSYPYPAESRCVFPASKTDGNSSLPYAIPEGARLQLDPSLTETDFNRLGLDNTGKIIARALQKYGMILLNYAGRPKIYAENLSDNPYAKIRWTDSPYNLTSTTLTSIPYRSFRVIALPEAYWNPSPDSPMHGQCFSYH